MNLFACASRLSALTSNFRSKTYQAHQAAEPTTVAATGCAAELRLDEELHDGHGGAVDGVLLVAGRSAACVVEQLGSLRHCHTDKLRLGAPAAGAASARRELLQDLWCHRDERSRTCGREQSEFGVPA